MHIHPKIEFSFYRLPFVFKYDTGTSLDGDGDTKVCLFKLCWVPSHIGIRGNERTNSAAKSSLDLSVS